MHQESVDKLKGTVRSDTLLFVLLIVFFFFAGTIATVLKTKFDSNIPLYALAIVVGAMIIIIYKLRIEGFRYTVFHKEPETEYDPRFDDYITHEDHPYPVGTVVIERTSSAKGVILEVIKKEELTAFLEAGETCVCDEELNYGPARKEKSRSVLFSRDGRTIRVYITASDEFKKYVEKILESK